MFDLEYNFHYERISVVDDIVLNLRHLEVSFWLLGLGFTIASLVFVGEIIVATCENRARINGIAAEIAAVVDKTFYL